MKLKLFTVHDSKVESYLPPFTCRNRGEALRSFEVACNDPESNISKYSSDYTLFEIADFDDSTGQINPHKTHSNLGLALDFKKSHNIPNSSLKEA